MAKKFLLTICGVLLLIGGVVLVLREWANLVIVFKGVIGGTIAVVGAFLLFLATGKSTK